MIKRSSLALVFLASLASSLTAEPPPGPPCAYVSNGLSNTLSVVNTLTDEKVDTVTVGNLPTGVAASGDRVYVLVMNREIGEGEDECPSSSSSDADQASTSSESTETKKHIPRHHHMIRSILKKVHDKVEDLSDSKTSDDADPDSIPLGTGYVAVVEKKGPMPACKGYEVIKKIAVGVNPAGVAVNPKKPYVYVANFSDSAISVINTESLEAVGDPVKVGSGPYGVTVHPDGTRVYVSNANDNTVSVLAVADDGTVTVEEDPIRVGCFPTGLIVSPDGSLLYVANNAYNTTYCNNEEDSARFGYEVPSFYVGGVSVIATSDHSMKANLAGGAQPLGVALSPDGKRLYVSDQKDNTLSAFDVDSDQSKPVFVLTTGEFPMGVSITPDGKKIYVANLCSEDLTVLDLRTVSVGQVKGAGLGPWSFGDFISP